MPTPERGPLPLNPIPENRQMVPGYRDVPSGYHDPGGYRGQAYPNAVYDVIPGGYHGNHPGYGQVSPGSQVRGMHESRDVFFFPFLNSSENAERCWKTC